MAKTPSRLADFEVRAELGEGGSAVVYDAEVEGRRVAPKVLREELALSGTREAALRRRGAPDGHGRSPGPREARARGRLARRPAVPRDAVPRRPNPGATPRARPARARGRSARLRRPRARGRDAPRRRDRAPRHQAGEHPPRRRREGTARCSSTSGSRATSTPAPRPRPRRERSGARQRTWLPSASSGRRRARAPTSTSLGVTFYMMLVGRLPWGSAESVKAIGSRRRAPTRTSRHRRGGRARDVASALDAARVAPGERPRLRRGDRARASSIADARLRRGPPRPSRRSRARRHLRSRRRCHAARGSSSRSRSSARPGPSPSPPSRSGDPLPRETTRLGGQRDVDRAARRASAHSGATRRPNDHGERSCFLGTRPLRRPRRRALHRRPPRRAARRTRAHQPAPRRARSPSLPGRPRAPTPSSRIVDDALPLLRAPARGQHLGDSRSRPAPTIPSPPRRRSRRAAPR